MSLNLTSVLKISIQAIGKENLREITQGIKTLDSVAKGAKAGLKGIVKSQAFQAGAVAAAGLTVAIKNSTDAAIDFDSSIRNIVKLFPQLNTPKGLKQIRNEINGLARELPLTRDEIASMYAAAAKSGIAKSEIREFTKVIGYTAIAWDTATEAAATAAAQLKTALQLDTSDLYRLLDVINMLSQEAGIGAMEIVEYMNRAGAVGKQAGFAAEETAAFGTAMIQSGASSKVAATSFRAMVRAFQAGDSATASQIRALERLGFGLEDSAYDQKALTQAVEEESKKRIRAIEKETDENIRQLNIEFRERMKILQRGWTREDSARDKAISRRYREQLKALSRQEQAEIEAARKRQKNSGRDSEREIYAIQDKYEKRRDIINDKQEEELRLASENAQDKRDVIKDALNQEKALRMDAIRERAADEIALEKEIAKQKKEEIKKQAKELANAYLGELQKEFAENPVDTILDFFDRIRDLPKELQGQTVSEFFGEQARALIPLIDNEKLLQETLALSNDELRTHGSIMKEVGPVLDKFKNKAQLAIRPFEELRGELGTEFAKAQLQFLKAMNPILELLNWLIKEVPGAKQVIAGLALAFVALVAALPAVAFILSIAASIKTLGGAVAVLGMAKGVITGAVKGLGFFIGKLFGVKGAAAGATGAITKFTGVAKGASATGLSGFLGKVAGAFVALKAKVMATIGGLGTFLASKAWVQGLVYSAGVATGKVVGFFVALGGGIKTALGVVAGILSGPVGWAILAAGLIALIVTFKDEIGGFFSWVGEELGLWIQSVWAQLEPLRVGFSEFWNTYLREPVTAFFTWLGETLYNAFVQPFVDIYTVVQEFVAEQWLRFREPVVGFFAWLGESLYDYFVQPWVDVYNAIQTFAAEQWELIKEPIVGFFNWWSQTLYGLFVEPFVATFGFIKERWGNFLQILTDGITNAYLFWSTLLYELFVAPFQEQIDLVASWFIDTWSDLSQFISGLWAQFSEWFSEYVVEPIQQQLEKLGEFWNKFWQGIGDNYDRFLKGVQDWFESYFVQPIISSLDVIGSLFQQVWSGISRAGQGVWSKISDKAQEGVDKIYELWEGVSDWFGENITEPIAEFWTNLMDGLGEELQGTASQLQEIWNSIKDPIEDVMVGIGEAFKQYVSDPIETAWNNTAGRIVEISEGLLQGTADFLGDIGQAVANAWNGFTSFIQAQINKIRGFANSIISAINKARSVVGLSGLPAFAEGGYVTQATIGLIGEAGPEYVIPADRMRDAAIAYLQGQRGESVVNARDSQQPKLIPLAQPANARIPFSRSGGSQVTSSPGTPQVNITTGPVVQMDGTEYVSKDDLIRATNEAVRQTYQQVMGDLRQPSTRQRLGIN